MGEKENLTISTTTDFRRLFPADVSDEALAKSDRADFRGAGACKDCFPQIAQIFAELTRVRRGTIKKYFTKVNVMLCP